MKHCTRKSADPSEARAVLVEPLVEPGEHGANARETLGMLLHNRRVQESLSKFMNVPSQSRAYLRAALVVLGGTALFALDLLGVVTKTGIAAWDQPVHDWFVDHRSGSVSWLLETVTTLSSPTYLTIIGLVFAALWVAVRREIWRPGLLMAAMGFTVALSFVIKHAIARPRPSAVDFMMGPDDALSFPSGHTLGASVFIFSLGYLLLSRHSTKVRRIAVASAVVVLIPAVAVSRLYLGYHWLSDVCASVTLAIAILGLVMAVDTWQPLRKWSISGPLRKVSLEPAQ